MARVPPLWSRCWPLAQGILQYRLTRGGPGCSQDSWQSPCKHLELPYDSCMLDYEKSSEKLVAPDEMEWKKETLEPIKTDNINKWKNDLKAEKAALIEIVCSKPFRDGFYEKSQGSLTMKNVFLSIIYRPIAFLYTGWVMFKNWRALLAIPRD